MFTKGKENEKPATQPTFEPASAPKPFAPAPTRGRSSNAPSIFSADLSIEGSLRSDGDVQFDGKIDGSIRARGVTIGEEAVISGEVIADEATVRGRVLGSIRARKVHLASTSHVEGDIYHNALGVESGAFFQGNCRHVEDPTSEAVVPPQNGTKRTQADEPKAAPDVKRTAAA